MPYTVTPRVGDKLGQFYTSRVTFQLEFEPFGEAHDGLRNMGDWNLDQF